jgi:hypothetical protein
MCSREKPCKLLKRTAWIVGLSLAWVVGSVWLVDVLAATEKEPNWTNITLAVATVGLTLATAGLAVAAFLALGAISESRHDRNVLVMNDLSSRWDGPDFRDVRLKIREIAGLGPDSRDRLKDRIVQSRDANYAEYTLLLTEPGFLEDLAISIRHGGVDEKIVKDSLGYIIWDRWCLWQAAIEELRDLREEDSVFERFEELAKKMLGDETPYHEALQAWDGPKY